MQWLCYSRLIRLLGTSRASTQLLSLLDHPSLSMAREAWAWTSAQLLQLEESPSCGSNALDSATAIICPHCPSQAYPTSSNKGILMDSLSLVSKRSNKVLPCAISALPWLSHGHPPSAPGEMWVGASRKTVTMTHQQNTFHLLREVRHGKDINGMYVSTVPSMGNLSAGRFTLLEEKHVFEETYWMTQWHRSPLLNWTLPFKPVLKLAISATQLSSQTQESKQTSSSFATKRYGPRICPWGVFGKFIHVRRRHEVIAHKDYEGSKLHTGSYWHIQFYKVHTYMCKWAFLSVKFVIKSNTYYSGLDQKLEYGFEKMQLECGIEGAIRYPAYLCKYLKHSNSYLHDSVCICWSLTAMMSVLSRGTSSLGINRGPACKPPICKRDTKTSI